MLQLRLGLGLGTENGFSPYLKVTNTFVSPSCCKCDVMLFIRYCLHGNEPGCLLLHLVQKLPFVSHLL